MQNNFETFVKAHRTEFDTFEPSAAIWQSIDSGIQAPSSAVTASKVTWLKSFAFGASIVTGVGYFVLKSSSDTEQIKNDSPTKNTAHSSFAAKAEEDEQKSPATQEESTFSNIENPLSMDYSNNSPSLIATATSNENGETIITVEPAIQPDSKTEKPIDQELIVPLAPSAVPAKPERPAPPIKNLQTIGRDENSAVATKDTIFMGIKAIEINSSFADIDIQTHESDQTSLNYTVDESGENKKSKRKNNTDDKSRNPISYVINGETLVITISANEKMLGKKHLQKLVNLRLDVPKETSLLINNSLGDIAIKGIEGKATTIHSSLGDVRINNVSTGLEVTLESGDLTIKNSKGAINSSVALGEITIEHFDGNINSEASSGDLNVSDIEGNITAKNSLGVQQFNQINGNIKSNCLSGDVNISNTKGNTDVHCNLGDINYENYKGNPTISSNAGNIIGKNVELIDNITISNSLGDISFVLVNKMDDLSFDLETDMGELLIEKDGSKIEDTEAIKIEKGKIKVKGRTSSGTQTYK